MAEPRPISRDVDGGRFGRGGWGAGCGGGVGALSPEGTPDMLAGAQPQLIGSIDAAKISTGKSHEPPIRLSIGLHYVSGARRLRIETGSHSPIGDGSERRPPSRDTDPR